MENSQDQIVKLFKEGLQGHEIPVNEGVWAGIQSFLTAQSAAGSGGSIGLIKAAAVVGISTVSVIGALNEVKLANQEANQEVNSIELLSDQADESNFNTDADVTQAEEWSDANQMIENQAEQSSNNAIETETAQSGLVVSNPELESKVEDGLAEEISKENLDNGTSNQSLPKVKDDLHVNSVADKGADALAEKGENTEPADKEVEGQEANVADQDETPAEDQGAFENELEERKEELVCSLKLTHDAKAFISADGDGTNDCFEAEGAEAAASFQIQIWTRTGDLLFESKDPRFKWCGTDRFGNKIDNHTVCYYQIVATDDRGLVYEARNAKGSITVFR